MIYRVVRCSTLGRDHCTTEVSGQPRYSKPALAGALGRAEFECRSLVGSATDPRENRSNSRLRLRQYRFVYPPAVPSEAGGELPETFMCLG